MTRTGTGSTAPDDSGATLYEKLLRDAPRTGCCPILLGFEAFGGGDAPAPPGDLIAAIDAADPLATLERWWPGRACGPGCPCGEQMPDDLPEDPAGTLFPDLARDPATLAEAARSIGTLDRLTMVDATRPADVPAVLGWPGIGNYQGYQDLPRICAVLRRWEARYGALLVRMDRSRLHLAVAYPPTTDDECRRAAAEHIAFCPDQQDPQNGDWYTLGRYAEMIRGAHSWSFWWD